jgi:zinc protease
MREAWRSRRGSDRTRCALVSAVALSLLGCARPGYAPIAPLTVTPDEDRTSRPPPPLPRPPQPGEPARIESLTLPNGLRVLTVNRPELPMTVVRFVAAEAGRENATGEDVALPELTARALVGAGTLLESGDELRDVELAGMGIEPIVEETFSALQFRIGSAGVDKAIALLARTVRHPTFAEVEPSVGELENELVERWSGVDRMTTRLLEELLFGANDRRAIQPKAWLARLREHGRTAVRRWHARYRPESSALVVVGRLDREQVRRVAAETFGDWTAPAPEKRVARANEPARSGAHVLSGGTPVSTIALAYPAVGLSHRDYWAIELLCHALAGTPTSAAWLALRHRAGISYHVHSYVRATRSDGHLVVLTYVEPDALKAGGSLLLEQIDRFRSSGLTQEELGKAKRRLLEQLELRQQRNEEVARNLSLLLAFGDPAETMSNIRAQIEALTAGNLRDVAARYLDRDAQIALIVGPYHPGDRRLSRFEEPTFYRLQP